MTTFAPLQQAASTLSATLSIDFDPASHASLRAVTNIVASTKVITVGGDVIVSGQARLTASLAIAANAGGTRAGKATLSARLTKKSTQGAVVRFPAIISIAANKSYGTSYNTMSALTSEGRDAILEPTYGVGFANVAVLYSLGYGLTGGIGSGTAEIEEVVSIGSDRPYAASGTVSTLPALISLGYNFADPYSVSWREYIGVRIGYAIESDIRTTFSSSFSIGDTYSAGRSADKAMADGIIFSDSFSQSAVSSTSVSDTVIIVSSQAQTGSTSVWVVNASTKANSRYENYSFNSLTKWGDVYIGSSNEGLFELTGDDDDGSPIDASIMLPNMDFDSPMLKRIPYVYIGAQSDNELALRVYTDDGDSNEYTIPASELLRNSRTSVGRGLYSRYWQFLIKNTDGGDFTIDTMEIFTTLQTRRI